MSAGERAQLARPLAHVGITVPDLDAAVRWYRDALGLVVVSPPTTLRADDEVIGVALLDSFDEGFGELRIAHLAAGNGVGVELFEFVSPAVEPSAEDYRHSRITHVCFLEPDIDAAMERLVAAGATRLTTRAWDVFPGQRYRYAFCRDPWGNVIELHSHSFDQIFSNQSASHDPQEPHR